MGKVSFKYGTASQLTNAPYSEGTFYVISDNGSTDGILYADLNNKRICFGDVASLEDDVSELSSSIPTKISELVDDSDFIKQYYGTCGTAAATVQKEVTINSITELTTGLTIFVKFTYANTAADPTLKLNNFDTKYIKRYGTTAPSTSAASSWNAGGIVCLTYDGTYWYLNDWNNTTYSAMSESEMKTGTATTGRNITAARLKQAVEYHAPVSSVNGQTGEVSISIPTVPTNVSDFTNDAGYLTSYTETDPTVPSWAKASTKPSYNFSEIGSTPTTISGYGITDAYTKTQVDGLVAGVLHYKGTKAAVSNLPTSGNTTGDTWHITADGSEWAWDGTTWQELGTAVDLSDYVTTDDSRLSDARTPTAHNQALSTITGADDLKAIEGLSGTNGLLKKTAANTWTLDTSNYLTSYTETDPVFSASAAANISSTDISNWNSKTSNTGTVTSIGLSNATDGGLTISGSPITNSGSITVGHSNVLSSAQTTQAVYPIKIDKNGHISAYGSAVTITDEKVKQTPLNGLNSGKGLLFSYSTGSSETTNTVYTSNKIMWNDYSSALSIYNSDRSTYSILTYSNLSLGNSSTNYKGLLRTANVTANRTYTLPDKDGTVALTSDIPDTSSFITSETDPVFSASAAAGITSTDISNWNAKVSDTGKWNNVSLDKTVNYGGADVYVPYIGSTTGTSAALVGMRDTVSARTIAVRTADGHLYAATPSANDNSTKVATTAYVDAAIPQVYNASTNTSGYLTMATLPIYDGTVV